MSVGEPIAEQPDLWRQSAGGSEAGSQESLASNASIPLPIPVRTRSAHGGDSDSGYNAMSIRRLERDTSVDRLSTGSRESNMSTQSDWLTGEKKKKSGLIGKLKAVSKNKDEKEFGSGSDISDISRASISSNMSAFAKAARKRALSRDRGMSKEKEPKPPPKKPEEANQPFDKYFNDASKSGVGTTATGPPKPGSTPAAGGSKWKVETPSYRRF